MKEHYNYNSLYNKIEKWQKEGSQDKILLENLFGQIVLYSHPKTRGDEDLQYGTKYSGLETSDLFSLFEANTFNQLNKEDLQHLMQEVHNRMMEKNDRFVRRNVEVLNQVWDPYTYGFINSSNTLLGINGFPIFYSKYMPRNNKLLNKDSVGKIYLSVVLHETEHNEQYERALDFADGINMNKYDSFMGALMLISNTNYRVSEKRGDLRYQRRCESMYDYHTYEHEANYVAIKNMEKMYPEKLKNSESYKKAIDFYGKISLHFDTDKNSNENEERCKKRVEYMENYVKEQLEYFEKYVTDCPLKQKIVDSINEYITVDEKGNSPYRKRFNKEVKELCDLCEKYSTKNRNQEKNQLV